MIFSNDPPISKRLSTEQVKLEDVCEAGLGAVYDYWDDLRGNRFAPTWAEFHLDELPPRLVPCLSVVDVLGPPFDFRYRFFGTKLAEVVDQELTGKAYYADGIIGFGYSNAEDIPVMLRDRAPKFALTVWASGAGLVYNFDALRLPLSDDGQSVTGVVIANRITPRHSS